MKKKYILSSILALIIFAISYTYLSLELLLSLAVGIGSYYGAYLIIPNKKVLIEVTKSLDEIIDYGYDRIKDLFDTGLGNEILHNEAQGTKVKINKCDDIKLKSFSTAEERISKMKLQLKEWEKIFTNYISNKGWISKIHKELIQLSKTKKSDF